MPYSVMQAARAIGRSKSTVIRLIASGKISATRDETTGAFAIDPAELHRLFPVARSGSPDTADTAHGAAFGTSRHDPGHGAVQERLVAAEARIAEMVEAQRLRDAVIDDLRTRLDAADAERRQAQAQLTALLADQRAAPPALARRSWLPWRR